MPTLLITGGAGYIGSQTNFECLAKGYDTIILDNLIHGHRDVVPSESEFIEADLLDSEALHRIFESRTIDGVIHFAAFAYVGESVTDPAKYYRNNIIGSYNLLEVMRTHGVMNLVFSSTCATYGIPPSIPITEDAPQQPINPYGFSKLVVERMLQDYGQAYGIKSIALRYFNACGADLQLRTGEAHEPETHLIPLILDAAVGKREYINVFGTDYNTPDGTCIRDYIHTIDLADAHIKAIELLLNGYAKNFIAINLGTGTGYSVNQIIDSVRSITGREINVHYTDRRPGDPDQLIADNSRAQAVLGWSPTHSDIHTIINSAWQWHQKMHRANQHH